MEETSVYMVHNSLKKVITVFQRFDPNSCKCTLGVSKFQLQTGFPVHFSVEKLGRVTCHMIALSICPSSSVADTDVTRALPSLIAGLFTPSTLEQKK